MANTHVGYSREGMVVMAITTSIANSSFNEQPYTISRFSARMISYSSHEHTMVELAVYQHEPRGLRMLELTPMQAQSLLNLLERMRLEGKTSIGARKLLGNNSGD